MEHVREVRYLSTHVFLNDEAYFVLQTGTVKVRSTSSFPMLHVYRPTNDSMGVVLKLLADRDGTPRKGLVSLAALRETTASFTSATVEVSTWSLVKLCPSSMTRGRREAMLSM